MSTLLAGPRIPELNPNQPFPLGGQLEDSLFPPSSRYHGLKTLTYQSPAGKRIAYLERRFLPDPANFDELRQHSVVEGDRLDNLAHHYLGDPEQFWRIADANAAMHPEELTSQVGRGLRVTLPEGVPGASNNA